MLFQPHSHLSVVHRKSRMLPQETYQYVPDTNIFIWRSGEDFLQRIGQLQLFVLPVNVQNI
jgi:hypothetical protein